MSRLHRPSDVQTTWAGILLKTQNHPQPLGLIRVMGLYFEPVSK